MLTSNKKKDFLLGNYIARYQIRYKNKRWVLISDLHDDSDYDGPLMFLVYEHAIYQMNLLLGEYRSALMELPMMEIVAFDYHGKESVVYGAV